MDLWVAQSRRLDPSGPHGGGEDEANYALSWFPHFLVTGSNEVRDHFYELMNDLTAWVERDCHHGYEAVAEAHHGIEPFLLFLPRYAALFPEDKRSARLLEDAAHHFGNWVPDIPDWYDYNRDRFVGYHLGTRVVKGDNYELAEHFRFIHVALAAYRATKQERFLEWALRYGLRRARDIIAAPFGPLPLMWGPNEEPLWESDLTQNIQKTMAAATHHVQGDPLGGVENMLASGAVQAFGDLFLISGDSVFKDAARRIVDPLIGELLDPYADPAAAAMLYYRRAFQDNALDERLKQQVNAIPREKVGDKGDYVLLAPETHARILPGVGKRMDMLFWSRARSDGSVTPSLEPCTAALTLAYHLTGDEKFAARALEQAARKLKIACRILRGGREHADMGGSVAAVAAGHGRNWGAGAVTGCYGTLVLGAWDVQGALRPAIEVRGADGTPGLPSEIFTLVLPRMLNASGHVTFYNGGEVTANVSWRMEGGSWGELALKPSEALRMELPSKTML